MFQSSGRRQVAGAAILATCLVATAYGATPGEVDATYGTNGRTIVAINSKAIGLRLPDGSLLVASQTQPAADVQTRVDLRHFDSEGHADLGFGVSGVAHHEFEDATDLTHAIARTGVGRIYLGGWTRHVRGDQGWLDMAVFAVNAQGGADKTFGEGGLVSFDLSNPLHSGNTDYAQALAIMPDGRILAGAYSSDYYYEWDTPADRLPQLLQLNSDGSLDHKIDFGTGKNVCSGISGLVPRTDGSLLVGDDTGIYALVGDSALQTFGVNGVAVDAHFESPNSGTHCFGLQSFTADQSGELLMVSAVGLGDGGLGFKVRRLNEGGTAIAGAVSAPPVPLARLVQNDERFAGSSISIYQPSKTARPLETGADGRLYLLFGFSWDEGGSGEGFGDGWAIARFAADGTLDTGWGDGGVVVLEKGGPSYWDSVPTLLEPLPDGRIVALTPNGVLTRLLGGQREGHGAVSIESSREVAEDAVQISVQVTRTGGSAGAISVDYSTTAIGAIDGRDFSAVSGRLDWADGDSSPREIKVPILDDTHHEVAELFTVAIGSPSGGAVLLNTQAQVTIDDDDEASAPPPPPPPPPPPSGGGGATDGLTLAFLLMAVAFGLVGRDQEARC